MLRITLVVVMAACFTTFVYINSCPDAVSLVLMTYQDSAIAVDAVDEAGAESSCTQRETLHPDPHLQDRASCPLSAAQTSSLSCLLTFSIVHLRRGQHHQISTVYIQLLLETYPLALNSR